MASAPLILTTAPGGRRFCPAVTTRSPAWMPCVTSTSSPSRRPVVTGTATALPTPCALASRTSTTLSPEAEVWIAVSGSTTALSVAGNTSAAVAYMPDCSTWSGLGSRACTVALRVWLSTRGSMELTLASNTRPGTASTLTCTVAPGASLGRSCCGSVKFTYNGSSCVNVATGSPAFRYWPTLTRRMPIWPANGAWTRFCSMRASSCRTAATAWAASALRCSSTSRDSAPLGANPASAAIAAARNRPWPRRPRGRPARARRTAGPARPLP